jgi:hypothetical protein
MKVTALRFTETVRARNEKAGGMSHLTFDQLALRAPLGQNTVCILMLLLSAYCNSRCYCFIEIAVLLLVGMYLLKLMYFRPEHGMYLLKLM